MIYVSAIAKWALEMEAKGQIKLPGTIFDFFYETDDEHFFDGFTRKDSVFYPKDGAQFFYTHEEFEEYLKATGNSPYPDASSLKPVQFMKVVPDGCKEYTIEWIANHFQDFHANWETLLYHYSPIDQASIRVQWGINEAIGDYIPLRYEIMDMRNAISVLMDAVTGKLTDEEKEEISSAWEKSGDTSAIKGYCFQEKRVREIAKTIRERHEREK